MQVGRIYDGRVTSVKDFGAFVEILPGKDGLCHISELADEYVDSVGDVCSVGDEMTGQGDRHRRAGPRQAQPQAGACASWTKTRLAAVPASSRQKAIVADRREQCVLSSSSERLGRQRPAGVCSTWRVFCSMIRYAGIARDSGLEEAAYH